ncbi:hypothetical protein P389DRAFT_168292 [Cystobasidium minutum MCA 4210]|uniref:uncharacterized protein n=1 Tax=Cystobasidium minutum MCA 4210 TaxID=1397322 RepID=UPI0034CD4C4C|eukprot:jgi/Rhomi1/168292/fgenesh1_kg.2_\
MTKILGRVHDGDTSTTAISHESLLEASELLQDNLGSSELTSRTIQWDNFPALMKLWEVLWQAQASLVQEADRLLELVDDLSQQEARLAEIKADLEEIKVGKREERDRHFALALYWRRHAIWRYFRMHLQHPEEARDLLHLYLVKPAGGGQQTGEACRPKCRDKAEQTLLLQIASTQRNRIRQLAQWLADHPEAAALLKDAKGKGKARADKPDQADITWKQKAHFERCLEEIEPRQRLRELIASTNDWIECFKSRLDAVQHAQQTLLTMQEQDRKNELEAKGSMSKKRKKQAATDVNRLVQNEQPKRRRTIDRGTSPIQELQDVIDKSVYLEASMDHGRPEEEESVHAGISRPAQENQDVKSEHAPISRLQEDDSPPSPQSLPSPPPPAQARQKASAQSTTDESQQSTHDSSAKPVSLPSVQSMPPVRSSSPPDDGFKVTIVQDTTTIASHHANGLEQGASTSRVKVERKPKKRATKLPPLAPEVLTSLEIAAKEAAIKRKEEKLRLGEFDYDPWDGLVAWVAPESHDEQPEQLPEPIQSIQIAERTEYTANTTDVYTAKSRIISTFDSLEAESSETASQGRREREENEARISEFLRSEDL